MNKQVSWYDRLLCQIIGHKISDIQLIIFKIKNNPINVERHGYSTLTCPRCKTVFDPENIERKE